MPCHVNLFVKDPVATYARVIEHEAVGIMPVADMEYGDRQGGVRGAEEEIAGGSRNVSKKSRICPIP
jgi:hypothetical protein